MKPMKALFFVILLFSITSSQVMAGNETKTFSDFYKKHQQKESISLNIPGFFFQFLLDDEEGTKELAKDIRQVKLLVFEDQANTLKSFSQELNECLPSKLYNNLMIVKDGGDEVTFKLREEEGEIREIIMIATDHDSSVILCIEGRMKLSDAKKLVQSIKVDTLKENISGQ